MNLWKMLRGTPPRQHGIIIGEICPYCQKHRSPLDFIRMPANMKICTECEQRHQEALQAFSTGQFTGECSECGRSAEEIREQKRCGPQGQMAIHNENGKYRVMCLPCDQLYVPLRRELFKDTPFAQEQKLF